MAERPFKILFEGNMTSTVAPQWQQWGQCAAKMHRNVPLDSYRVVQSSAGENFLISKAKSTGPDAFNSHAHANRFLSSFAEVGAGYGIIFGGSVCGSTPQEVILKTTTTVVADKLPQEPAKLSKALSTISPMPGDLLVWVDLTWGGLIHSSTIIGRVEGEWLVDDKMNLNPPRKTWVTVVANDLYRPETPKHPGEDEEGEWHPERGPSHYEVQLRRPK